MSSGSINKKNLTETDIITKFIMPSIKSAGWDDMSQIRQEVALRDGKVIVRGQVGKVKVIFAFHYLIHVLNSHS
ncbi:hypothetical protein [Aliivibrio fischeri]|uniref:hypothetical protein n=1 Tax=Aliivibrio fischeri TaxID=668 RepID=UPI0007C51B66|nr:hypothetical protein [Aliivibrio fischeri]